MIRAIGLDTASVTLATAASADFEAHVRNEAGKWASAALHLVQVDTSGWDMGLASHRGAKRV
jgi:hypothetical protein